jgi:hypothetical protein
VEGAYGHKVAVLGILRRAENALSSETTADAAELCIQRELP